jgi:hypothetical protein
VALAGQEERAVVDARSDLVRGHQFDGFLAQDSRAVERTAVQQHVHEASVVHDRRRQALAARLEFRRFGRISVKQGQPLLVVIE